MAWFSPQDCGCCGADACCTGLQTCLEIDITIGTADCCDIGDLIIRMDAVSENEEETYCIFDIASDEYPPTADGGLNVYWLQPFTSDDYVTGFGDVDCNDFDGITPCYSEFESANGITYYWAPWYVYTTVELSKTTGHAIVRIGIVYLVYYENVNNGLCFINAGGGSLYTFESSNCLAGPFTLTDTDINASGFRGWIPPECDVTINDLYECV